jgi:hypothetical protein
VFFEPLPPERTPEERKWAPPLWDRPSEGAIPAVLAVNEIVLESDDAVVLVEYLSVYPNGFTVHVGIHLNPHRAQDNAMMMRGPGGPHRFPRVGVRFSDGREGGRKLQGRTDMAKDENGLPIEPFISFAGGGGGGPQGWRFGVWVYPLPPEGPLEIFVGLPAAGLVEASVTVDGAAVRAAASKSRVVWS